MNPAAASRPPAITGNQLMKLMHQLRQHAGITIESPQSVIEHHVQGRISALGVETIGDYLAIFDDSINARAEWLALIDLLTVKETRFFRQPAAMETIERHALELISGNGGQKALSFWSAGCSTGQELYSIAMVIENIVREQKPWFEWHGIGTDISFLAVNKAQRGEYRESAIQSIPANYRQRYVQRTGKDQWQMSEDITARTHFFHSNLLHVNSAPFSDFDVVVCQNVLIYFQREMQHWIIDQLVDRLKPGGLLVLGAGEDVRWNHSRMERLATPGVCAYKKMLEV